MNWQTIHTEVFFVIEKDTIKMLRECDAGIRMGVESINDVIDSVEDKSFKNSLLECKTAHEKLGDELRASLDRFGDKGKKPNAFAKGMSKIKTDFMLSTKKSDRTVADLMTDGCNMGVKSLSRYLNQYSAADEDSKDIAKRLISLEEELAVNIRRFL